jgi:hypothetical protein
MSGTIIIRRSPAGYLVESEPPMPVARKRFLGRSNRRFSRAVGFASRLASELRMKLRDDTGRLTAEDCGALLEAWALDKSKEN